MVSHFLRCSKVIFTSANVFRKPDCRFFCATYNLRIPISTVNSEELKKFDSKSDEWWQGKTYEVLRLFNSGRIPLIRDGILSVAKCYERVAKPLEGYSILDVGCGGGILSEPLARLGAKVTGLDPGLNNIEAAIEHASKDPEIKENITYVCDTVENLTMSDRRFDAVVASEVIEHVDNISNFVHSCVDLTKKNGSLFFTTMNRTSISFFASILIAEYALDLVPRGTHDWNKFVKPTELMQILESLNCRIVSLEGNFYNPITKRFSSIKSVENMYSLHAVKL